MGKPVPSNQQLRWRVASFDNEGILTRSLLLAGRRATKTESNGNSPDTRTVGAVRAGCQNHGLMEGRLAW